jgi:hypothetical protein
MNIQDLPLPLRLRNALAKAGFKTDDDLTAWVLEADASKNFTLPGIGVTGMQQLMSWYADGAGTVAPESVLVESETPEESIARGAKRPDATTGSQRHDISALLDHAMRGGLDKLTLDREQNQWRKDEKAAQVWRKAAEADAEADFAEQWDAYRGELAKRGAWVETKTGQTGRNMLILHLETDIQARVTALIPTIKALPHVKELGVEVSAETVGRMALIRGLDALERAHGAKNQAEKPAETAKNVENSEPTLPTGDEEVFNTPEGWTKCGPTDKIPVPEAVLHDYYTQNGWFRYWGMVDGQPIYFYWCPERRLQELGIFPGADKSGRKMAVQETPWGPGHVVPAKWTNS